MQIKGKKNNIKQVKKYIRKGPSKKNQATQAKTIEKEMKEPKKRTIKGQ